VVAAALFELYGAAEIVYGVLSSVKVTTEPLGGLVTLPGMSESVAVPLGGRFEFAKYVPLPGSCGKSRSCTQLNVPSVESHFENGPFNAYDSSVRISERRRSEGSVSGQISYRLKCVRRCLNCT